MKLKNAFAVLVLCCGVTNAFADDGWKGPGQITFVQPEIYRDTDETGKPILIGTTISAPDCLGSTTWVIRADLDSGNRLYAAVIAALTAGKSVKLYQWSCIQIGGTHYARVGAVSIVQ
jgi:uncharacterized protein (DUF1786 family)